MKKLIYKLAIVFEKEVEEVSEKEKTLFASECYFPILQSKGQFRKEGINLNLPDLKLLDVEEIRLGR